MKWIFTIVIEIYKLTLPKHTVIIFLFYFILYYIKVVVIDLVKIMIEKKFLSKFIK